MPANLSLSQPGLQQLVDTPYTYTVYGNNGSQILNQILNCTPVHSTGGQPGIYAASTAYAIDWQFSYTGSNDICTLNNVQIGLHVNQVFPDWQASNGDNSMASAWQGYISKLHAYESGHVALDQQAAQAVLNDLQDFPPTACEDISQQANAQAAADVHSYDVANANYDTNNDYGIKQGIVL
jgi:predicted secreted Zn-dependent protease